MEKLKAIYKKFLLVSAGFIFVNTVVAQTAVNDLQQKFISYQTNNYNEKIFLHTDKTSYLAGESIWFKAYCVDENFHKLSNISKVAYIEVINKYNKPVLQGKIALNNGTGNGSFIIPSFVASGNYIIRAYTKWMENFSEDYFFQSNITIINTLKAGFAENETQSKLYNINFFPESGNLVDGITSKIAFKVVDANGLPVGCSGSIFDAQNNNIANFQTQKFGMGSFSITPKTNEVYKAIIKFNDTTIIQQLPVSYKQGFVMHLEPGKDSILHINVSTNTSDGATYLLVQSQNILKDFQQANTSNGNVVFNINKNKLADGISVITLFNANKQPVCERLYFKKPSDLLTINLQPDKNKYALRSPVNVLLLAKEKPNVPVSANMSVSVFMTDSLQSSSFIDILSYLLLSSELKGTIPSPSYYFQDGAAAEEAADNLMLTQGWRRFKWDDVLQNKQPYFQYLPDYEGLVIDGKLVNKFNNSPASNIETVLTAPGENFQLATSRSDASGNILYNIKNFYGTDNVIISTDSNYSAVLNPPYSTKFSQYAFSTFTMPEKWKNQVLFGSINMQVDNAFLIEKKQHSYNYNNEDTSAFYGTPDKRYNLDDYTRFTTMEEVLREYITEVRVKKESNNYKFRTANFPTKTFFEDDPLVLIDGMPVTDLTRIINFDPLKIKRLDIVAHKYYFGDIVTNGIVSFSTYNGDLAGFPLNSGEIVIKFDGLQREREFYSPVYDKNESNHLPDVRNVLYWSPKLQTGADGRTAINFYTSDLAGKFICIVQGITPAGTAGSNFFTFDVQ